MLSDRYNWETLTHPTLTDTIAHYRTRLRIRLTQRRAPSHPEISSNTFVLYFVRQFSIAISLLRNHSFYITFNRFKRFLWLEKNRFDSINEILLDLHTESNRFRLFRPFARSVSRVVVLNHIFSLTKQKIQNIFQQSVQWYYFVVVRRALALVWRRMTKKGIMNWVNLNWN